jgi:hypothetical protein
MEQNDLIISTSTNDEMSEVRRESGVIEINDEKVIINIGDSVRDKLTNNVYEVVDIYHVYEPLTFKPVDVIVIKYGELGNRSIKPEHIVEVIKKGE